MRFTWATCPLIMVSAGVLTRIASYAVIAASCWPALAMSMAFCSSTCSSLVFTPARAPAGPDAPGASAKSTGGIGAPRLRTGTCPDEGANPGATAVTLQGPVLRPMIE